MALQFTAAPASHIAPRAEARLSASPSPENPSESVEMMLSSLDAPLCCRASVARTLPGPISSKTPGVFINSETPEENCTGRRKWRAQYAGSVVSAAVAHVPVTPEMYGTC